MVFYRKVFIGLVLCWAGAAYAACTGASPTWTSTVDQASVASCVSSAVNGDTINIQAGSATWTTGVSWTNKNIKVIGAGVGNTIITASGVQVFNVNMSNTTQDWRISGMTIQGSNAAFGLMTLNSAIAGATSMTKGWRVDHIRFNYTSGGQIIWIKGITAGVIDNIVFDGTAYGISLYEGWMDSSSDENQALACTGVSPNTCLGYNSWNRPTAIGSDEAVYMEDVQINLTAATGDPVVSDLLGGGAMVIRFSTINIAYWITHSARFDLRGGRLWEVYNNTFNGQGLAFRWAQIRSGTFLAFHNTVSGYSGLDIDIDSQRMDVPGGCRVSGAPLNFCDGTQVFDTNTESNGWRCLDQIGRGGGVGTLDRASVQTWMPAYSFGNGSTSTCATAGTCNNTSNITLNGCGPELADYLKTIGSPHSNGEVDYVNNSDVGKGLFSARPSTCTKGAAYWATDQGNWNGKVGALQGRLYRCVATDTWELYYTPYKYPHPTRVKYGPVAPVVN